jgi:hypothetical protein
LQTGKKLPDARLYTDSLETKKTDDYTITRRQLSDLVNSSKEAQKKREDYVLNLIASGQTPDAQTLKEMDVDINNLQSKRYDDYQMSLVKSQVSQADFERFREENLKTQDDFTARVNASVGTGRISPETGRKLIGNYKNELNNRKLAEFDEREGVSDELNTYRQKAQGYVAGSLPQVTDEQINNEIATRNLSKLTEEEYKKGQFVGQNVSPFTSGIIGGSGRNMLALAAILRPLSGVLPSWYSGVSKQGQIQVLAEQENSEKNPGVYSSIVRLGGGAPAYRGFY